MKILKFCFAFLFYFLSLLRVLLAARRVLLPGCRITSQQMTEFAGRQHWVSGGISEGVELCGRKRTRVSWRTSASTSYSLLNRTDRRRFE